MNNIAQLKNISIDLGNIKSIELDADPLSFSDGHLIITLLKGKEYVYNEKIDDYVLIEPVIKIYGSDYGELARMEDRLIEQWNQYLEKRKKDL